MQLAVASGEMVIGVPDGMGRVGPSPLVRCVRLRGAPPSTIAVAWRRGDRRPEVAGFVERAQRTAARRIGLLGGAVAAG
jgi:hypothetical protein